MTTTPHAADRLLDALERAGAPICVGLDPVVERLPSALAAHREPVAAISAFTLGVLDAVAPHVGCVKLQSACYERYGPTGVEALRAAIRAARERELVVILDAKRGDIGISAEHYASGIFDLDESSAPDWVTVNAYLGADGIRPFLRPGRGAFALVRTSNPGGDPIQGQRLADGRTVAELVAGVVDEVGRAVVGPAGYSALGAVVGATKGREAAELRRLMPRQILLVPGFGAQGAGADDVAACFDRRGRGAVVTASRSVIYAFEPDRADWRAAVSAAARSMAEQVAAALGAVSP